MKDKILEILLKYTLPSFDRKIRKNNKQQGKLEELLVQKNSKPKKPDFLNDLLNLFSKDKKIKTKKLETNIEELEEDNAKNDSSNVTYSALFERKKDEKSDFGYKVEITYEETEIEESIKVKVEFEDYSINKKTINQKNNLKDNKKEYSISIKREKERKTKDNYSISLVYESNYEEERLSIDYKSTIGAYLNRRQEALHNFEDRVPGKWVDILPASVMGGILGFTYLGQDRMTLRDDLIGDKKMVDIHESIHTPDEYETRVLTDWIMSKPKVKYVR